MRPRREEMVVMRLSRREKTRWGAQAADEELSVSELVRLAVREYVERRGPSDPPDPSARRS
jgi:hypothetical protein